MDPNPECNNEVSKLEYGMELEIPFLKLRNFIACDSEVGSLKEACFEFATGKVRNSMYPI